MRGPSTRHARHRAGERLQHPFSPQRQQDMLNRLRKGQGIDLSRKGRDRGRWYLEDSGEHLVLVTDRKKTTILTLWRLQPGTRADLIVERVLAPIREAKLRAE